MTLAMARAELADALANLTAARASLVHRHTLETDEFIAAALKEVQSALDRLSRPMSRRPLTGGHARALAALAAAPLFTLSDTELRAVIGRYATNVIGSLSTRRLIRRTARGHWRLTQAGYEIDYKRTARRGAGR